MASSRWTTQQAIKNSIDNSRGWWRSRRTSSSTCAELFGYSDRIIDNILEPEDRDAFYMLEDTGILTTEREETTLYDGREWRIHYWLFKRDKIQTLMASKVGSVEDYQQEESIYADLPDDIWHRGGDAA